MNLKTLFVDDDAVSPVIGVILMVAITVILAAVIGTFVLGLGDQVQSTSPSASFTFDYTNQSSSPGDSLEVTHDGGDSIDSARVNASVTGATDGSGGASTFDGDLYSTGEVSAGTTDTLDDADFSTADVRLHGATIRVVWSGEGGDNSATLGKWSGPDA